ncbi:MAG: matrixin family metalloprotease [Pseudomonadota bacterium]
MINAQHAARLGAALMVFAFAAHSHAFCLTHTCEPKTEQCEFVDECNITGKTLFWASSTISFDVQEDASYKVTPDRKTFQLAADGSKQLLLTPETLDMVATNAFYTWVNADCGGGAHPKIRLKDLGFVSCGKPEYNKDQPNANVIAFHDAPWPYTDTGADTLALTTVFFNGDTGEIYDANVEINTNQDTFAVGNADESQLDLNAVLTHELGHFLGLSHSASSHPEATMYSSYMPGMVTLAQDDEDAICASLPPDRTAKTDSYIPRHGWSGECAGPGSNGFLGLGGCCSTAVGSHSPRGAVLGLWAFGLGLAAFRGRTRRKRTPRA